MCEIFWIFSNEFGYVCDEAATDERMKIIILYCDTSELFKICGIIFKNAC
jgi:hypothetical protein